ncbi:TetR family transcriptional regulator [Actinomyces sp.]|uniref:TetR family transcriptional regulator n=1 Tax=Actinomyces sp. TaxID=29317 RepID=UPI0026DB5964|nr:TetR family transcriptional regulator [Actinomyces sp.]MDO4901725.1 TetR family transcriptional regulator [Actinomyces sp.]
MPTVQRVRGPYAKTAAKREAIARAAYEVVQQVGHEHLTTAAVARRAGMAERTMLYHFPSRDHLLVAALEYFDEVVQGRGELVRFREQADAEAPALTEEAAEATIGRLIRTTASGDARLRLYGYLAGQAQIPGTAAHEHFAAHYAEAIAGISIIIGSLQQHGLARTDRPAEAMARRFLASWDGLQQLWVVSPDFDLEAEIIQAFADTTGRDLARTRDAMAEVIRSI